MISTRRARGGVLGSLLLCGALALTACSSAQPVADEESVEDAAGGDRLVPAAEGVTTYPLTLETEWGSSELAERPERIAAVTPSQDDAEILAALGVTPIIASEYTTDEWVEDALPEPIPERFSTENAQFPVEQIAAAEPDLIVVLNTDLAEDYDRLASVAPVLSISQETGSEQSVANDWETNILRIGEVLDLPAAAQQALDDEEAFFADFRADHPELAGLTASYVVYYGADGGLQFHSSDGSPVASVLERMGFVENPDTAGLAYRQEISDELLSSIDADVIIFSDNSDGDHAAVTEQPLFQQLSAVENGRLVMIDNRAADGTFVIDGVEYAGNLPWALARSGPLSATWAADKLAAALTTVLAD